MDAKLSDLPDVPCRPSCWFQAFDRIDAETVYDPEVGKRQFFTVLTAKRKKKFSAGDAFFGNWYLPKRKLT